MENATIYQSPQSSHYTGWGTNSPKTLSHDYIARVKTFEHSQNFSSCEYICSTSDFVDSLKKTWVLKDMMRNLWSVYLYNQEYISFLLGAYTKEEFKQIARKHAQPFTPANKSYIHYASKTAFEVLNQNLTSGDLSLLLNIDTCDVEKEMNEIGYNKTNDCDCEEE